MSKEEADKKRLRPHQTEAVNKSAEYFKTQDRGKLIMACGTGKTFTSLRVTETITPGRCKHFISCSFYLSDIPNLEGICL